MGNLALNFVAAHQQWIEGLLVGAILSNPGTCALIVFQAVTRIPGVGLFIAKHPDQAKAWADGFDKRIDQLVDQYAASQVAPPAPTPAPAPSEPPSGAPPSA